MVGVIIAVYREEEVTVRVCDHKKDLKNVTVAQLKRKITRELESEFPDNVDVTVELYFKGELLDEDLTLSDYEIRHRSRVETCLKIRERIRFGAGQKKWRSMEELADFKDICSVQ